MRSYLTPPKWCHTALHCWQCKDSKQHAAEEHKSRIYRASYEQSLLLREEEKCPPCETTGQAGNHGSTSIKEKNKNRATVNNARHTTPTANNARRTTPTANNAQRTKRYKKRNCSPLYWGAPLKVGHITFWNYFCNSLPTARESHFAIFALKTWGDNWPKLQPACSTTLYYENQVLGLGESVHLP